MHPIESAESPPPERRPPHGTSGRAGVARVVLLCVALVAAAVAVQLGGWDGSQRLQAAVESAGPAGAAVFVLGYAVLVLIPSPASVLTVLAGALFGLGAGIALAWAGAVLGAFGGFVIGRLLGRDAIDRMLGGRLADADRVLRSHGLAAVLAVRLLAAVPVHRDQLRRRPAAGAPARLRTRHRRGHPARRNRLRGRGGLGRAAVRHRRRRERPAPARARRRMVRPPAAGSHPGRRAAARSAALMPPGGTEPSPAHQARRNRFACVAHAMASTSGSVRACWKEAGAGLFRGGDGSPAAMSDRPSPVL